MQLSNRIYLVGAEQFGLSHALDCNCYLIDAGQEKVLVDTGTGMGATDILANMESHGFAPTSLTHILITHAHLGHWGAGAELRECTGARVFAPKYNAYLMEDLDADSTIAQNFRFGRYPAEFAPRACPPDETFQDGDELRIGDVTLRCILSRGHTTDSTCFFAELDQKRVLFSGDVVFYGGMLGLNNAEGCSLADYREDIGKLSKLKIDALLPGHAVFILRNGQKHIDRAARKLADFVMPETFFEGNEFLWDAEYRKFMLDQEE